MAQGHTATIKSLTPTYKNMNILKYQTHLIRAIGHIVPILLFTTCLSFKGIAQQTITGTVTSQHTKMPLQGATVIVLPAKSTVKTDSLGSFAITVPNGNGTIEVSFLGYEIATQPYTAERHGPFSIILMEATDMLDEVIINTGYQNIPRERATGSFDHIDNELINRSVSTDILSRLENLSSGLLFNHGDAADTDPFLIRGRSTITANAQPLIVLDDFPYDGDLNNINPNDIESVSILKDAAAASIWGARAGNGVIVITTKKGTTAAAKVEVASNVSFTGKPDLYNLNQISPSERIEVERFLFENGRYAGAANPTTVAARITPLPEAVELIIANPTDLEQQLALLANHDVRDDMRRYLYRTSANQQYNINVSGNQERRTYYMSGGFDRNLSNLVGENYNRVSIRSGNTFKVNDRLNIDATINFFHVNDENGNNNGYSTPTGMTQYYSPYSRLVDGFGNANPVYLSLRKGFVDTIGSGRLLDWTFRPIDEINNERHSTQRRDYLLNIGSSYMITEGLTGQIKYQFQNQVEKIENLYREQSYYARNLINDFTQINPSTGAISYPFPIGGIFRTNHVENVSHQGRGQLNFDRDWNSKHTVTALTGFEIRQLVATNNQNHNVGYNEETGSLNTRVDTETLYRTITTGTNARIGISENTGELRDNFISYFSNAAYTYLKRYTLSASFRKDEANLFGVDANQKGTPLWSVGGAWEASNEPFYHMDWLPHLKIRASYGVSGNISRAANAQSTITLSNTGTSHQLPSARLGAPPNRNLTWEKVKQLNIGFDFATKNNRLSGTVEYYIKNATNLLARSPVDPTYGVTSMHLNVADMKGRGLDVQISSINIDKTLKWRTSLIYSHSTSEVTNYFMPVATSGRTYLPISLANPLVGKPLYSVFALAWEGLDHETGNPVGIVGDERSMDYNAVYNSTALEDLVFMGTAQPTHFGALMNSFSYKNIELSFNISFKSGYYFRRSSLLYGGLFNSFSGHSDFALRWQQPGDEIFTDVPSMIYPAVANRDNFYQYSEMLVERGDHIRLEDLNIGYRITPVNPARIFKSIRVFAYLSNLGMVWDANSRGIDPYFNDTPIAKPMVSFGTNITF